MARTKTVVVVRKVIGKPHEDLKFDKMNWEVVWIFLWRPQGAIPQVGASDPPLSLWKNLSEF